MNIVSSHGTCSVFRDNFILYRVSKDVKSTHNLIDAGY